MVDAREYHERTNHSPASIRSDSFSLDHTNKPRPFKSYENLPQISLPEPTRTPEEPALTAVATSKGFSCGDDDPSSLDGHDVRTLCHYATGVTKKLERQGRLLRFRAASCTGKLYHIDLYAVTGDLDGLDPGIYHFGPDSESFDVLREGDYRGVLARSTGNQQAVTEAPVTFIATSQWWRNAWKYRARTYRHAFWDSGTILANLLAVAHGSGQQAMVVTGFADEPISRVLGIDPETEAPLELIPVGSGDSVPDSRAVTDIAPAEVPLSENPVEYSLIVDAWKQSTLSNGTVDEWRERFHGLPERTIGRVTPGDGVRVSLNPVTSETASTRPVWSTIERRGSLREFSHEEISSRQFATILDRALRGVPLDCFDGENMSGVVDCYCLVHAVDGIPSGAYHYHGDTNVLERLGDTDRRTAGHLALDQPVVGDAAANVYLMADVDALVEAVGNRGYRVAQLEGGVTLGRLYLATYAHRALGGRGFTFYDDLVREYFSPRAENQTPMTLFAFGKSRT